MVKLAVATFGVAALVGAGYVIGKKLTEMKQDEWFDEFDDLDDLEGLMDEDGVEIYVKECADCGGKGKYKDKIKKASYFAAGVVKTSADKFGETIQDIKSKDMVKKGEETFDAVKETGSNIKSDIKREVEDLKTMVASINDDAEQEAKGDDLFGGTKEDAAGNADASETSRADV
ncbi:MAG: hypothetical protein FWG45_03585 [Oscillospiraceae bacterium]|nr:hypothetical protein [Oscillospiraceae bacterium]